MCVCEREKVCGVCERESEFVCVSERVSLCVCVCVCESEFCVCVLGMPRYTVL